MLDIAKQRKVRDTMLNIKESDSLGWARHASLKVFDSCLVSSEKKDLRRLVLQVRVCGCPRTKQAARSLFATNRVRQPLCEAIACNSQQRDYVLIQVTEAFEGAIPDIWNAEDPFPGESVETRVGPGIYSQMQRT